jgi:hypothetical protein
MRLVEYPIRNSIRVNGVETEAQEVFINKSSQYLEELLVYADEFSFHIENFDEDEEGEVFREFYRKERSKLPDLIKSVENNIEFVENNVPDEKSIKACANERGIIIQYLMSLNNIAQKQISNC